MNIHCPINNKISKNFSNKHYLIEPKDEIIFLKKHPSEKELKNFYNSEYKKGVYSEYVKNFIIKKETAIKRIGLFSSIKKNGLLLDVGCSSGLFIETALEYGFDAYGVEISTEAVRKSNKRIKKRISNCNAENFIKETKQKFDVITAFDLIEHTTDPILFIKNLKSLLKKNGILVITTPDTSHFLRKFMGRYWPMLQPYQHLYLFSKYNFSKVLTSAGFSQTVKGPFKKTITIDYIFNQLAQTNRIIFYLYKFISKLIPPFIKNKFFSVNIGEFYSISQISKD